MYENFTHYLESNIYKVFESNHKSPDGTNYCAYGIRYINNKFCLKLLKTSVVVISINHTMILDDIKIPTLNIIPLENLQSGDFILYDYKIPISYPIYIRPCEDENNPIIKKQKFLPFNLLNGRGKTLKEIGEFINSNNYIYKDIYGDKYNLLKFEGFNEVYCINKDNPQLVTFSNLQSAQYGKVSFSKFMDFENVNGQYIPYYHNGYYGFQNDLNILTHFNRSIYNSIVNNRYEEIFKQLEE